MTDVRQNTVDHEKAERAFLMKAVKRIHALEHVLQDAPCEAVLNRAVGATVVALADAIMARVERSSDSTDGPEDVLKAWSESSAEEPASAST